MRVVADGQVSIGTLPRRQAAISEVHLYAADLDDLSSSPTALSDLVTAGEVEQAQAYGTALLERRFIRGRGVTRAVLAGYVGGAAPSLQFDRSCPICGGQNGKPRLKSDSRPGPAPEFSVSRSGPLCLVAVSAGGVGVDVEVLRHLGSEAVAKKEFSEAEADFIRRLPSDARDDAFLALWVRKEALAKAAGTGLTSETLTTSVLEQPARIRLAEHGSWTVVDVPLGRQARAAIAARPEVQTIRVTTVVGDRPHECDQTSSPHPAANQSLAAAGAAWSRSSQPPGES